METTNYSIMAIGRLLRINSLRKLFVVEFIFILIFIQGLYVLRPLPEIFPFSNYPMFSSIETQTKIEDIRIKGIINNGTEVLLPTHICFPPLDRINFRRGVKNIVRNKNNEYGENDLNDFFQNLLIKYEMNRKSGYHSCPEVHTMNLYWLEWDWTNVDPKDVVPDIKRIYSTTNDISELN